MDKTKFMALVLLTTLLVAVTALFAGCGSKENSLTEDDMSQPVELVWYCMGPPPVDLPLVMEKLNDYTKQKLNCTVKLNMIDYGDYGTKMKMIALSNENYDIAFTCNWAFDYNRNAASGTFLQLDGIIEKCAPKLLDSCPSEFWRGTKVQGKTYGVPYNTTTASVMAYYIDKSMLQGVIDPAMLGQYKAFPEMLPVLEKVKAAHPGVTMYKPFAWFDFNDKFDFIKGNLFPGAVRLNDKNCKVFNQWEDPEVSAALDINRLAFQKGLTYKEERTQTDAMADFRNKKLFCYIANYAPYADIAATRDYKLDVMCLPVAERPITNTDSCTGALYAVSVNSKHPARALMFLELLNSDKYLRNLIGFGIEGTHYKKLSANVIEKTERAKDYSMPNWYLGNLFLLYLENGDPADKWQKYADFNKTAIMSPLLGFTFDAQPVSAEVSAISNAVDEYAIYLAYGQSDPKKMLPEFQKKIKNSGVDKVLAEMQRQIDAWRKTSAN